MDEVNNNVEYVESVDEISSNDVEFENVSEYENGDSQTEENEERTSEEVFSNDVSGNSEVLENEVSETETGSPYDISGNNYETYTTINFEDSSDSLINIQNLLLFQNCVLIGCILAFAFLKGFNK